MQAWMWIASLGEEETQLLAAPATPLGLIVSFFKNVQFVFFGGNKNLTSLPILLMQFFTNLLNKPAVLGAAIFMVFGWWGVRKVIRMLFRAFRKGQINA